ncbi:MAG: ADP-ribosylglycohydrolase family protein [Kineosporiaceae bacterium]|nr:ADP-ribosylglycohydrolase family protein [Kineosporiaceae bacterium]
MTTLRDRARGALIGLALGDALGMPTQELSRARAEELLAVGPCFLAGPPDNPISAGLPAGSITDDTEQALLLGEVLVEGAGVIDPLRLADALLEWQEQMAARGSLDLLGPSTRAALQAVRAGADPATTGRHGTTNGAAMRIAPLGIATAMPNWGRGSDDDAFVAAVHHACRVTHDTPVAVAGAAAVAAVISVSLDGASWAEAVRVAMRVARCAQPDGALARRLDAALDLAASAAPSAPASVSAETLDHLAETLGTSLATLEAVPAAFAIAALSPDDAWRAGWLGARLGGDSDTIAAMAGAMVGAATGFAALPGEAVAALRLDAGRVVRLVDGLVALRHRPQREPMSVSRWA